MGDGNETEEFEGWACEDWREVRHYERRVHEAGDVTIRNKLVHNLEDSWKFLLNFDYTSLIASLSGKPM